MSKSKSRQSSRQAVSANRSGFTGTTRSAASKTALEVAVKDAPENAEQESLTATDTVEEQETSAAEEKATSAVSTAKAASNKATVKISTEDAAEKKEASAAKAAKATSAASKAAPAKVSAKAVPNTPPLKAIPNTPAGVGSKLQSRDAAKYERRQAERQMRYLAERRQRRNRIVAIISVILVVAILAGGTFWFIRQYTSGAFKTTVASQGTFQEPIFNTNYPPIDSVYCDQLEQSVEHIHAYIVIYINGNASPLPAGVGIPQDQSGNTTCFYWLHTHDTSGIVHIEAPSTEVFTFGQFRDEWDQGFQSLGFPTELLLSTGWKIWINGKVYNGSLTSVPLEAHNIVTLAYNSPKVKPATTYNWGTL